MFQKETDGRGELARRWGRSDSSPSSSSLSLRDTVRSLGAQSGLQAHSQIPRGTLSPRGTLRSPGSFLGSQGYTQVPGSHLVPGACSGSRGTFRSPRPLKLHRCREKGESAAQLHEVLQSPWLEDQTLIPGCLVHTGNPLCLPIL